MPILDQALDPTDPSFDPAMLQRLLAANAQQRAQQVAAMDPSQAPASGTVAPDVGSFGILNGAPAGIDLSSGAPAAPAPAMPSVPLPTPDPRASAPASIPVPRPDPRTAMASAPSAPTPPASSTPLAAATAPTAGDQPQPAVPDTSLLGRIKTALNGMGDYINTHPTTLMALGGGLAGAPSWGTGISRGLTAAAPALRLDQQLQIQKGGIQAAYQALQQHFVSQGDQPGAAGQKALALVYNPDWMKEFGPKLFGTNTPQTTEVIDPATGMKHTAVYDPTSQRFKDVVTGQLLGKIGPQSGGQPGSLSSAGDASPSLAPPGGPAASPYGTPVARPGVSPPLAPAPAGTTDVPAWNAGQIEASNKQSAEARTRAQGGEETIQKLSDLEHLVNQAPEEAFGKIAGANDHPIIGSMVGRLSEGTAMTDPASATGPQLREWHDRLQGAYSQALDPLSRAIDGSGGGTGSAASVRNPAVLDRAQSIVGGTDEASKAGALQKIQDAKVAAWDGIQEGIRAGVYDTSKLPKAATSADAKAMGRGAIYLGPDGQIYRNPT